MPNLKSMLTNKSQSYYYRRRRKMQRFLRSISFKGLSLTGLVLIASETAYGRQYGQGAIYSAHLIDPYLLLLMAVILAVSILYISSRRPVKLAGKPFADIQQNFDSQTQILTKRLYEKELIIREIHHRVKNNMQIVVSLLNTQSSFLDSKNAAEALLNSQHRIQAMAIIHQKLYQSESFESIDLAGYILDLGSYLKECLDIANKIDFLYELDELITDIGHAVPLGLIVNEAMSNAVKYAFNGSERGIILIKLSHEGSGNYLLTIKDNGKGLPVDYDKGGTGTMGMSLMRGLAAQLKGQLTLTSDHGLCISLSFKKMPSADAAIKAA